MERSEVQRRRPKAATIFEVAALAGVSKSTVSNVVLGTGRVSGDTREAVLAAIERLGYRPNTLARQFVRQRTTILGVVVGDLENPFNATLAKLVEQAATARGYSTMFCNVEGKDAVSLDGVRLLLDHRVAGILFLSFYGRSDELRATVSAAGVPVVFVGLREDWGDSVAIDERGGARLAVQHLIDLGHSRIAYITTPILEPRTDKARYSGYRAALKAAGLEALPAFRLDPSSGTARTGAKKAGLVELLGADDSPTAFFASNDLCALSVLEVVDSAGLRVPGDVSVVSFDNVAWAGLSRISLTTVAQPYEDLARLGVDLALQRIEGSTDDHHSVTVPAELVVRTSAGPPPGPRRRKHPARAHAG